MSHEQTLEAIGAELLLEEVNGILYASNRYWIIPVDGRIETLLHHWNLKVVPGHYEVEGERVSRRGDYDGPMAKVPGMATGGVPVKVERRHVSPVCTFVGVWRVVFEAGTVANRDYLRFVFGDEWDDLLLANGTMLYRIDRGVHALMAIRTS